MKKLLILGAGTAGTMMANHLNKKLNKNEWSITIIDQDEKHYYQPGFLFIPFEIYSEKDVIKEKRRFLPPGVEFIQSPIQIIEAEKNQVKLNDGKIIPYDILIIATGCRIVPSEIEGLDEGWRKNIFDFYTFDGSVALRNKLKEWKGGRLVVHLAEMPIKCPVAPLEFLFLSDWFFAKKGIRKDVDITYVTPLGSAFTKPRASAVLGNLFVTKNIHIVPNFNVSHVEADQNKLVSLDGKEVEYDLLVTIPTNMGDEMIERSGLGDELNFVPTDKHTLQSKNYENIFVIGDATDIPASKAGSVAHFEAEILTENIISFINNKPLEAKFDGHANCYIESGYNKAFLIDFNYDVEPVEGTFPLAGIGPFSLLKETRINHLGKMAFKFIYWNMLLKGIPIPTVPPHMKTSGKKL
ncbi:type III sulfide quinone reductase, selenoprotein subtype [Tepidibacillus fermentans]|uniref:Sulfide:quinone oxidoreductase n=1 Tax=Tepidibacillus fermentans TaxID=1281767 RepID=A0A4R3KD49_9BACI|nr:FAD/NAD(P)-binding oxidoreductase [Tepidibacillus fermentans]TCS81058.1 sulfide:quinone oxidoreductase [Tepidibacillus fermentans]